MRRKLPAVTSSECVRVCVCLGVEGVVASSVTAKTHTYTHIRLYGETNPVTLSGNVSALVRCNLDFAETESPWLQNLCVL